MTGAANKLSLAHGCPVREWEAVGLDKPPIARLDRIAEIPARDLGAAGRISRLAEVDMAAIKTILTEITR